jgi:hypothetical protein
MFRTNLKHCAVYHSQKTDGDVWSRIDETNNPLVTRADCCVRAATIWDTELNIESQVGAVRTYKTNMSVNMGA